MNVAMIPARGGSKRIRKKNIREFCSKPIIAYSIEAALRASCFDRIIVSTDDPETASIVLDYGAEVPFIRPKELSGDYVSTIDVTRHTIQWLLDEGNDVDYFCCIYATVPLISASSINAGLRLLVENPGKDYAYTVCSYPHPIQRALELKDGQTGTITMSQPKYEFARTQDLEAHYYDAGQFYWGKSTAFMRDRSVLSSKHCVPIIVSNHDAIDIDVEEDWKFAEKLFRLATM